MNLSENYIVPGNNLIIKNATLSVPSADGFQAGDQVDLLIVGGIIIKIVASTPKSADSLKKDFLKQYKKLASNNTQDMPEHNFTQIDEIDATGLTILPGLVDTHIHGLAGMDATRGESEAIARALAPLGTTSVLPTTMTASAADLARATNAEIHDDGRMAHILGYHLEGPYISVKKAGAQNQAEIRVGTLDEFENFTNVRKISLAPEAPGNLDFVRSLKGAHPEVTISLGHSDAGFDDAAAAFDAGVTSLTHTFNAMKPLLHREPGPVGAAINADGVFPELIGDGLHIAREMCLALYRIFGARRICLISDSIQVAQQPDGVYECGGVPVRLIDGVARIYDPATDTVGTLAGGSSTLLDQVRNFVSWGVSLSDAVMMASETPARSIGADKKGRIASGMDADLVLVDAGLGLSKVILSGAIL